jgi:hypothetical protein
MFLTGGAGQRGSYFSVTESRFHDNLAHGGMSCLKFYSQYKPLVADNAFFNIHTRPNVFGECFAQKATTERLTFQGNTITGLDDGVCGVCGNMHGEPDPVSAEIRFNNVRAARAMFLNQDGLARDVYVYRNTVQGGIEIRNTGTAGVGPFTFSNNVIESNDATGACAANHTLTCPTPADPARVVHSMPPNHDLVCTRAEDCVNDDGTLRGTYTSYLGVKGFQLADGGGAGGGFGGGSGAAGGGAGTGGGSGSTAGGSGGTAGGGSSSAAGGSGSTAGGTGGGEEVPPCGQCSSAPSLVLAALAGVLARRRARARH